MAAVCAAMQKTLQVAAGSEGSGAKPLEYPAKSPFIRKTAALLGLSERKRANARVFSISGYSAPVPGGRRNPAASQDFVKEKVALTANGRRILNKRKTTAEKV